MLVLALAIAAVFVVMPLASAESSQTAIIYNEQVHVGQWSGWASLWRIQWADDIDYHRPATWLFGTNYHRIDITFWLCTDWYGGAVPDLFTKVVWHFDEMFCWDSYWDRKYDSTDWDVHHVEWFTGTILKTWTKSGSTFDSSKTQYDDISVWVEGTTGHWRMHTKIRVGMTAYWPVPYALHYFCDAIWADIYYIPL
ncbi:MAG: hypothetical protein ACFFCH_06800 [Promethearchaeota archaeon]